MCIAQLHVGGLVAVGLDPTGRYLLTVSHSGRGVYDTETWHLVARDIELAYPDNGMARGIGPIEDQCLAVQEIDYETSSLHSASIGGKYVVSYDEGVVTIDASGT